MTDDQEMDTNNSAMIVYYQSGRTLGVKNHRIAHWLVKRSLRTAKYWCRWLGWTCVSGPVPNRIILPMNSEAVVRTMSDSGGPSRT